MENSEPSQLSFPWFRLAIISKVSPNRFAIPVIGQKKTPFASIRLHPVC